MKINILGTEYELRRTTSDEDPELYNKSGYCDFFKKIISVSNDTKIYPGTTENMESYNNNTLRHEIIHAFLHESGLTYPDNWGADEEVVEWIALQFPKLLELFQELKVI